MKASYLFSTLLVASTIGFVSSQAHAVGVSFGFDPTGGGSHSTINALGWGNGNAVSVDLPNDPVQVGDTFYTYYSSFFSDGTLGPTPILGTDTGIRIFAGFREQVVNVSGTEATFQVVDDALNFVRIVDFDNGGAVIFEGTPIAGLSSQSFFDPNAPTFIKGEFNIAATVDSFDSDYWDFNGIPPEFLQLVTGGTTQEAFQPIDFGAWQDINGVTPPGLDGVDDFVFGVDANGEFNVVPEPVTATLGLMGLAGIGAALRRRRA